MPCSQTDQTDFRILVGTIGRTEALACPGDQFCKIWLA
ncbi:hypothetical protein PEL8287_00047 [Roseovarius litorisediminis]|uniref:Uncharacterized protein n=1 Tax=Roseovarius litorisediminis TaxID=1312363 RepID=A0A1Y5R9U2_9RHOB|nr:hypothetical protein PEL8287_00047 [Roseovarius litorisediminis]